LGAPLPALQIQREGKMPASPPFSFIFFPGSRVFSLEISRLIVTESQQKSNNKRKCFYSFSCFYTMHTKAVWKD
jgi:hypothetical protein